MVRIVNYGASGKMGKMITKIVQKNSKAVLASQVASTDSIVHLFESDVVIVFTSAQGLTRLLDAALVAETLPVFVVGTTGIFQEDQKKLEQLALKTVVFQSANFSLGIAVFQKMLSANADLLSLYQSEIFEVHHEHKLDAPSGTALLLQSSLKNSPPIHATRVGSMIGKHEIHFYGSDEVLSISHIAYNRRVFAFTAVKIAMMLVEKRAYFSPNRVYKMHDILESLTG
jgi:4-hydroxy-tetrahydrodipicolinate reductase